MSHMQSVPGGVEQEALAEEKELAEGYRPEKGRRKIATGEGRLAFFLVTPTVLLLALIVGYPIVKAVINSFQKDPGLNSRHRLLQPRAVNSPDSTTTRPGCCSSARRQAAARSNVRPARSPPNSGTRWASR